MSVDHAAGSADGLKNYFLHASRGKLVLCLVGILLIVNQQLSLAVQQDKVSGCTTAKSEPTPSPTPNPKPDPTPGPSPSPTPNPTPYHPSQSTSSLQTGTTFTMLGQGVHRNSPDINPAPANKITTTIQDDIVPEKRFNVSRFQCQQSPVLLSQETCCR